MAYFDDCIKIIESKPESLCIEKLIFKDVFHKNLKQRKLKQRKKKIDRVADQKKNMDIFLQYLTANRVLFKEYCFDRFDNLKLTFELPNPADIDIYKNANCWVTLAGDWSKNIVSIHLLYYFESDIIPEYFKRERQNNINNICQTLGIKPTLEEREDARQKEKKRIKDIEDYFYKCSETDTPITFYDFINNKIIPIKPSSLFKDLGFVQNEGAGFYRLHYMSSPNKTFFYSDGLEDVKGHNTYGYSYDTIEEKNNAYIKYHKKNTLLEGRFLKFNDCSWLYFFFLMQKQFNIPLTVEPFYGNSVLFPLNYSEFNKVYSLEMVKSSLCMFETML